MEEVALSRGKFYLVQRNNFPKMYAYYGSGGSYTEGDAFTEVSPELPKNFLLRDWWTTHQVYYDNRAGKIFWIEGVTRINHRLEVIERVASKISIPDYRCGKVMGLSEGCIIYYAGALIWKTL